jgi:hypothetical protein
MDVVASVEKSVMFQSDLDEEMDVEKKINFVPAKKNSTRIDGLREIIPG